MRRAASAGLDANQRNHESWPQSGLTEINALHRQIGRLFKKCPADAGHSCLKHAKNKM